MKISVSLSTPRALTLIACALVPVVISSCRVANGEPRTGAALPDARAFDDMARPVSATTLDWDKDSTGMLVAAVTRGPRLIVVDARRAELRVHALATGKFVRVAAQPGIDVGDFRLPSAAEPLDGGRFVVFDSRRALASFRDSTGAVISEARLPRGFYGGFAVKRTEGRLVLTGMITDVLPAAKDKDIHEFDFEGRHIRSYGVAAKPESDWASRFAAEFVNLSDSLLITGAMNVSRLRVLNRATMQERWLDVAPGWQRLEWPSDRLLGAANRAVVAERLQEWRRNQRLMTGVFSLSDGRLLVRFEGSASDGGQLFNYVLSDLQGRTLAISRATRKRVVAAAGDTVRWLEGAPGRQYSYGSSIVAR